MRSAAKSAVALAAILTALPAISFAQPSPERDKVAAQALFEEGRQLVTAAKFSEACPKFADSQRLDPSPSTLLNLASCWEKLGRTATAWAVYREAESAASAAKRSDYVAVAERHAASLAPTLARLTIAVSQPVDGLQIKRDDVTVGSAEWGVAIPVDAGSHAVEATAAAYKGWKVTVDVPRDGAQLTVTVPVLEPLPIEHATAPPPANAPPPPTPSPPAMEPPPSTNTQRVVGLVVGGVGLLGLGASGVIALVANAKKQDSLSDNHCPTPNQCDVAGVSLRNQALAAGDAATVAFAIGAAALVTGGVLWLTAPHATASRAASIAAIAIAPGLGGAIVEGSWQ